MILENFRSKQIEYMKAGQTQKLEVLRYFLAQIKNKEIELRPQNVELKDEHIYKVLRKLLKQIDETVEMCEKAGRLPALEKAQKEKLILKEFEEMFPLEMRQQ